METFERCDNNELKWHSSGWVILRNSFQCGWCNSSSSKSIFCQSINIHLNYLYSAVACGLIVIFYMLIAMQIPFALSAMCYVLMYYSWGNRNEQKKNSLRTLANVWSAGMDRYILMNFKIVYNMLFFHMLREWRRNSKAKKLAELSNYSSFAHFQCTTNTKYCKNRINNIGMEVK